MNWKSNYFARHLAQKGLGAIPGLFRLQEWFKDSSGRWDELVTRDFLRARALQKADQFERAQLGVPRHAVEQGTGWHGLDLVFLHLAGTQRIDTFDTRPWLQARLLHRCFRHASTIADAVARWSGADPFVIRARANDLEAVPEGPLEELLGRIDVRYHVTCGFDRPQLESESCDLFFSDSVLQRLRPVDLVRTIGASRRFLGSHGRQHHVIDCKDFHSINDPRVPELYYLGFRPRVWGLMTSTYLNYQNRWRKSDFVDLFRRAGCEVEIDGVECSDQNVRWLRDRAHKIRLSRVEPLEEAAVTRFELRTVAPAEVLELDLGEACRLAG